jgi:hypothetical protein
MGVGSVAEADCPTRIASDTFSGIGALIPARIFIRVAGTFFRTRLLPYCTLSVCFDRFPLRRNNPKKAKSRNAIESRKGIPAKNSLKILYVI